MASPRQRLRHVFTGGWATDLGPTAVTGVGDDGAVRIPYLLAAADVVFQDNGGIRKAPGSAKINSSQLESGADIIGVYDAWFSGTSGSATQARVINIGTKIKADAADGTFVDLFTGLSAGAVPTYAMLEDLLIVAMHSSDVPRSWDGSTAQNLAGTPPNFGIVCVHAGRLWVADVWSAPSYVYYSPYLDPENATSEGWGRIAVDPDDGDVITGLASHRGELIVFKGPYKQSIHRIQGTAPTGSDAFRRPPALVRGVSAAWHNLIFPFGNDLGFVTPSGQIQTLQAVQQYGDFDAAALSRGLNEFSARINFARLKQGWAATNPDDDQVAIALPVDGASACNFLLVMDYGFQPVRFTYWPSHACTAVAVGVDASASNRRVFYTGGADGYVRKLGQASRVVDSTEGLAMLVTTPFLDYNEPFMTKTLGEGYVEFTPHNSGDIDFFVRRDSQNRQQFSVSQVAGDPLGTVDGTQFTLGVSALASSAAVKRFLEMDGAGDFRQIQYEFQNDLVGEDVEVHGFGMTIEIGPVSTENDL